MITTFHIAVYLVYYVWDTFISRRITDNTRTIQDDSDNSESGNKNQNNPTNADVNESGNNREVNNTQNRPMSGPSRLRPNSNISPGDVDSNSRTQNNTQALEGGGDCHCCLPQGFSDDENKESDKIFDTVTGSFIGIEQDALCTYRLSELINYNPNNPAKTASDMNPDKELSNCSDKSDECDENSKVLSGDVKKAIQHQNHIQKEETDVDGHPCLPNVLSEGEDRGQDIIYNVQPEYSCICTENKIQFFPPVYIQRYMEIDNILKEPLWTKGVKKVVEFGCAELSFVSRYLKKLYGIEEIVAVDIDEETLLNNYCKVSPCPVDYLNKRPTPLTVRVFHGSVAHTHDSLTHADAVIAIELIEHLFPPELESLPFTIFGFMKPKIAIFTTPNSDFNVLFMKLSGFRHPDHKFEWSQQQFQDWAHNLVQRYPDYQVTFKGIGPGPTGSEKLGCCSQMATFIKVNETNYISADEINLQDGPYTLVAESVFPFFKDERTYEEKVRDEAEHFIKSYKMRCRINDELKTELPMTSVMKRIKYFDQEKLKQMLMERNSDWDVKINSDGEEVVVFPNSEEDEDSEPEENEYVTDNLESIDDKDATQLLPDVEENWDNVDDFGIDKTWTASALVSIDPEMDFGDNVCLSDDCYRSVETVSAEDKLFDPKNTSKLVSSDKVNLSSNAKCSILENTVPEIELCEQLSSSLVGRVPDKDSNLNFEKSIYETPYNDFSNCLKSNCDLCDSSLPLSGKTVKGCKRALPMESPKELSEFEVSQSEEPLCCLSTASSSCDTSIYATPSCPQLHKNNIPKCLSLQQISTCGSPAFATELETLKRGELVRDQNDKFSKSMEGFKSLETDLTYSSTSRIVDSGYPDSDYNMDMDLTPEQFDEIETESEKNDASSRSLSPLLPQPQIPWLIDDVQNGDVANNNRDGEGNNLVADMEEEPLEFEARIDEINNAVLNLAPADEEVDCDHDMKCEPLQDICGDCLPCTSDPPSVSDITNLLQFMPEKSPNHDLSKPKSVFTEKNIEILSDSQDKHSLRSTKSDTSISTNCSYSLDLSEGQMVNRSDVSSYQNRTHSPKLKMHNSLTTVLDGHSKFSNCSLVRPVDTHQVIGLENYCPDALSKSIPCGSKELTQQEGTANARKTTSLTSTGLQGDRSSLLSVYQSAESLNNVKELHSEYHNENSSFPDWLLKILVPDTDYNEVESVDSVQSVWDSDSLEERLDLNYDVQVDARGGGDPQRESWH